MINFISNTRIDKNVLQNTKATAEVKSPAPSAKCCEAISRPSGKQMNACANECVCCGIHRHIPRPTPHKQNALRTHARLSRISKVGPFSRAHSPTDWQTHMAKHSSMQSKTKGSFSYKCGPHSNSAKSPNRSHKLSFAPKCTLIDGPEGKAFG
jgi:hypothetical protein